MLQNFNLPDSLLIPRHNDTDTTASDISETEVETSEFVSDDKEHAKRLFWVFYFWQEIWCKPE